VVLAEAFPTVIPLSIYSRNMDDFLFYSKICATLVGVILVATQALYISQVAFPAKQQEG